MPGCLDHKKKQVIPIGYFPGKQTATPSKPKSTGGSGGSSTSGTTIKRTAEQEKRAKRFHTQTGSSHSYKEPTTQTQQSADVRAELTTAPKTPDGVSGSPANSAQTSTGQQIVESFKAPSSQFRYSAPSALIREEYYNKAGEKVTIDYGSAEEQVARRDAAKRTARAQVLDKMRDQDRRRLYSGLREQQSISRQLRSGLVRPEKVPELKSKLVRPVTEVKPAVIQGGIVSVDVRGGRPLSNLGYRVSPAPLSADQIEKRDRPVRYHAKKYLSGAVKGVGAGMLGYAATQTSLVSGAGAAGASVSLAPAAVVAGGVLGVAGAYVGTRENIRRVRVYREGGFSAVWNRETQRAKDWRSKANKYSGEIVEGVAAVTFAIPTYISAESYYSSVGAPMQSVGMDRGRVTRTGPEFTPTTKQVTKRTFKVGSDKYVVKAKTTAKENILPGTRSSATEKTVYDVYRVGDKGKLNKIKTVSGQGEVQLKQTGEFVRFSKVGDSRTEITIGQMSRAGKSDATRFYYESATGQIKNYGMDPATATKGYVERVKTLPAKPGRVSEVWKASQTSKEIPKVSAVDRAVFKGFSRGKTGTVLLTDTARRGGSLGGFESNLLPDTEIAPVYGSVPAAAPSIQPMTILSVGTPGARAALTSALVPSVSAGSLLVGGAGAAAIGRGVSKSGPASVTRPVSISYIAAGPQVTAKYLSLSRPLVSVESPSAVDPLTDTGSEARVDIQPISRTYVNPVVGVPGTPGVIVPPPKTPPPGIPLASLPPAGGTDSWARALLKKSKQPKGYTPSATALAFGIKGKSSAVGTKSGFGLRPIVEPKKRKKKFRV